MRPEPVRFLLITLTASLSLSGCCCAFHLTSSSLRCHTPLLPTTTSSTSTSLHAVKFVSPLLEAGYPPAVIEAEQCLNLNISNPKPLLLYLPGFDGTLVAPFLQFPELSTVFEVRGMEVPMDDRSTFAQLRDTVVEHLLAEGKERPIYIMGESFGGLLLLEVAMELQQQEQQSNNLCGIVLVNPATCYLRSSLAELGPDVAALPEWRYPIGVASLLPLFVDDYGLPQLLMMLKSEALPSVIDTPAREAYMGRTAFSLPQKLKFMPRDTLRWRLGKWLTTGNERINDREEDIKRLLQSVPALVLAGEEDKTLPAVKEAKRLQGLLHDCKVHYVDGAGHAGTCGSRVDIAALMRHRFPILRQDGGAKSLSATWPDGFEAAESDCGRISMKEEAAVAQGKHFGMTSRYDGNVGVGLSPFQYWTHVLYRKWVNESAK